MTGPVPPRPPALCDHCPHGYVFTVLRKLDLHVMGASIGMHLGFEKAQGCRAGTFCHHFAAAVRARMIADPGEGAFRDGLRT